MKNDTLSPLLLSTSVGPFAGLGSVASATPLAIYNPNNTAMLIDQIRFSFPNTNNQSMSPQFMAALGIELLLGSIPITNRHVTLGALAPLYNGFLTSGFVPDAQASADNIAVWHLPKPLYVPPLVQLAANYVSRYSSIPAVRMSVVGRSLPSNFKVPNEIEIPWVTETRCDEDTNLFVSRDSDLVNSNNVPLDIVQFVGCNLNLVTALPTPVDMTVQMSLSNGTMLIRDPIPFFLAFPSDRGSLPVSARLQPGEFVRAELENPSTDGDYDSCAITAIAMHGYRKIQTPGTLG